MSKLTFEDQTIIITGAGCSLGRQYAVFLASRGANIVVNECGGVGSGAHVLNNVSIAAIEKGFQGSKQIHRLRIELSTTFVL